MDKELNSLIYRTLCYVNIYESYKLSKNSPFLAHPAFYVLHFHVLQFDPSFACLTFSCPAFSAPHSGCCRSKMQNQIAWKDSSKMTSSELKTLILQYYSYFYVIVLFVSCKFLLYRTIQLVCGESVDQY